MLFDLEAEIIQCLISEFIYGIAIFQMFFSSANQTVTFEISSKYSFVFAPVSAHSKQCRGNERSLHLVAIIQNEK